MAQTPPALSGSDELRETVDLLAQVLASISDRLDSQGHQLDALLQLGQSGRNASASSAQSASVENLGEGLIGKTIIYTLGPIVVKLEEVEENLRTHRSEIDGKMQRLLSQEEAVLNRLRKEAEDAEWAKVRHCGFAAGVGVLGLLLGTAIGLMF
ncbi:hypothetical protein ACFFUC_12985 [Paracoccus cavernae]|uniref:hypothetical protein n=1 Tax=Paracoccus cavernae TaxID=1571207 RepID=UPI0035F23FEE